MQNKLRYALKTWVLPPAFTQMIKRARDFGNSSLLQSRQDRQLLKQSTSLKDRHTGTRCFILGAGSSIANQDLKKLRDEFVISVSNTFVHPDFPLFHPRYHVTPHILYGHSEWYSENRFVDWLKEMERGTLDAEMFFHIGDRRMIERNGLFKNRTIYWVEYCSWGGEMSTPINLAKVPHIWSVSELAITIAVYMGFDQIYLLGIDHDWFIGPQIYFYDQEKQHALQPHRINLGVDSEFQMRRHADIFRKYKYLYSIKKNIYNANANPRHYMDVFPKVDYDTLFIDTTIQR